MHHFGSFYLFFNWERVDIGPQIRLRKIPEIVLILIMLLITIQQKHSEFLILVL